MYNTPAITRVCMVRADPGLLYCRVARNKPKELSIPADMLPRRIIPTTIYQY